MTEILDYWNRSWQSVRFDPVQGKGRVRWLGRRPRKCGGWAMYHERVWYAVRLEGNNLVFQVGPTKWPIDESLRCQNTRHGGTRTFRLLRSGEVVLQIKYGVAAHLDEPTADKLDLETTDFFYWVATVWNDGGLRASLKTAWKRTSDDAVGA